MSRKKKVTPPESLPALTSYYYSLFIVIWNIFKSQIQNNFRMFITGVLMSEFI